MFCQENLIVNPKLEDICKDIWVGERGSFSGQVKRNDGYKSGLPIIELSNIGLYCKCHNEKAIETRFEFNFMNLKSFDNAYYIQGEFCHKLVANTIYNLSFLISAYKLDNLKHLRLYIMFSDTVMDGNTIFNQLNENEFIRLDKIINKSNGLNHRLNHTHLAKGNEKYFQIIVYRNKSIEKFINIEHLKFISNTDTLCSYKNFIIHKVDSLVFDNIVFKFNEVELVDSGKAVIRELVNDKFRNIIYTSITIVGHTDTIGSEIYNEELSLKRAIEIKNLLISLGVQSQKWLIQGKGESNPLFFNSPDFYKNRRFELYLEE